MRLNGDYWSNDSRSSDEEKENERVPMSLSQQQKLVVGYALTSKKVKSFLQPKLEGFSRKRGVLFVEIYQHRPLSKQGPFDIVLHKDYREKHPEVTVLDPPDAIQHLLNRQSMLQDVADLNVSDSCGKVCVPKQLVISKDPSSIPDAVTKAGLITFSCQATSCRWECKIT